MYLSDKPGDVRKREKRAKAKRRKEYKREYNREWYRKKKLAEAGPALTGKESPEKKAVVEEAMGNRTEKIDDRGEEVANELEQRDEDDIMEKNELEDLHCDVLPQSTRPRRNK